MRWQFFLRDCKGRMRTTRRRCSCYVQRRSGPGSVNPLQVRCKRTLAQCLGRQQSLGRIEWRNCKSPLSIWEELQGGPFHVAMFLRCGGGNDLDIEMFAPGKQSGFAGDEAPAGFDRERDRQVKSLGRRSGGLNGRKDGMGRLFGLQYSKADPVGRPCCREKSQAALSTSRCDDCPVEYTGPYQNAKRHRRYRRWGLGRWADRPCR